jgi:hypothetical protein
MGGDERVRIQKHKAVDADMSEISCPTMDPRESWRPHSKDSSARLRNRLLHPGPFSVFTLHSGPCMPWPPSSILPAAPASSRECTFFDQRQPFFSVPRVCSEPTGQSIAPVMVPDPDCFGCARQPVNPRMERLPYLTDHGSRITHRAHLRQVLTEEGGEHDHEQKDRRTLDIARDRELRDGSYILCTCDTWLYDTWLYNALFYVTWFYSVWLYNT